MYSDDWSNMSRTKQLQTRPENPTLEEILSDLESAPLDDVAFSFLRNRANGTEGSLPGFRQQQAGENGTGATSSKQLQDASRSFESASAAKRPRQENPRAAGTGGAGGGTGTTQQQQQQQQQRLEGEPRSRQSQEDQETQDSYLRVVRFLEMNSYLKDSQDKLSQQCSDLQELGLMVKDQIESLRTQLQSS